MIRPLPHTAANQPGIPVYQLPVIRRAAGTVPHSVNILAQEKRPGVFLFVFAFRLDKRQIGIHGAVNINAGVRIPLPRKLTRRAACPLVMHQPAWVPLMNPVRHSHMIRAKRRLVSQGPHNHARMIFVPLHQANRPVKKRGFPLRHIGRPGGIKIAIPRLPRRMAGAEAVHFQISLVNNIETVPVAQTVKLRRVGIMGTANRVDIVPLHQFQIPPDMIKRRIMPHHRIGIMTVDAL